MMNFKPLTLLCLCGSLSAETITLSSEDTFQGELVGMTPEKILLKSDYSPEPIAFRADSFSELLLSGPREGDPFQTERIVLSNGDIIPGNLLALGADSLTYEGLAGGKMTIPRQQVATLRFGIRPQKLKYRGPAPLDGWSGNGVDNWVMSDDPNDGLLMLQPGELSQDFKLGDQFKINFDVKWQENPSVRLYFGDDLSDEAKKDRYYIDLNSAGLQVRRERSSGSHYKRLGNMGKNELEAFDDNRVNVELRVNRLIGSIDLFLDGKLERQMFDSSPPTRGDGITIVRNRTDNSASYLSKLEVFSWDAVSQVELLEEQGDGTSDSIIDSEGKRMSGTLLELRQPTPPPAPKAEQVPVTPAEKTKEQRDDEAVVEEKADAPAPEPAAAEAEEAAAEPNPAVNPPQEEQISTEKENEEEAPAPEPAPEEITEQKTEPVPAPKSPPAKFLLESPFAEEPIEISAAETRIIYFARNQELKKAAEFPKYELDLANEGVISAKKVVLENDSFLLEHPILGSISVPRNAVRNIRFLHDLTESNE